ncbi:MAG TPA: carbonic anhydrase [Candidatus Paceibacterota bacterium]|nr:carbonic anhydrase [Candidatus Paceibacterota bacterium]
MIEFESPKGHYDADACIVWCFDDRFYKLLKAFGKRQGWAHIDLVKVAGGARALAGGPSPDRDFILGEIKKSIRLHHPGKVVLMLHQNCGAYGDSDQFADTGAEDAARGDDLAAAVAFVKDELPGTGVVGYYADFKGIYPLAS